MYTPSVGSLVSVGLSVVVVGIVRSSSPHTTLPGSYTFVLGCPSALEGLLENRLYHKHVKSTKTSVNGFFGE